jgi:plasmid stabilization system protein ParE
MVRIIVWTEQADSDMEQIVAYWSPLQLKRCAARFLKAVCWHTRKLGA